MTLTLRAGQTVHWKPASLGWAQIIELRRTRVRLCYLTRKGRLRFALVPARALKELVNTLPIFNPLNRAIPQKKEKAFEVATPPQAIGFSRERYDVLPDGQIVHESCQ